MAAPNMKPPQLPLPQTSANPRMTLAGVIKGKLPKPYRIVAYGPEGVGKSTFGAEAPSPIFLGAEDGTSFLDVARFPTPEGGLQLADVYDALRVLVAEKHEYRTLVLDTLDWLEPVVWAYVCQRDQMKNIEDYGYGKGYSAALDEWRKVIAALERMQTASGMHVILLAHSQVKGFKNPAGDDYDRYSLKLHDKAAGLVKEWCDDLLFMKHEEYAQRIDNNPKNKRARGVSTGARLIYTQRRAAWDAKTRHNLPEELPLSWADFESAAKANRPVDPDVLREEIARKAAELGGELEKTILETVKKAGANTQSLVVINNRVNAKLAEKEQVQG